jgi:hypothetical protein
VKRLYPELGACPRISETVIQKSARGATRTCVREGRRFGQLVRGVQ